MTAENPTMILALLFLLSVAFQHCQAAGLDTVQDTLVETTIISSPAIDNVNFQETVDMMNSFRHLQVKEAKVHKNPEKPFFHVLLATLSINVFCMVALLSLIPMLLNLRWNFFKSLFWVANSHVQLHPEVVSQFESLGIPTGDTKSDDFDKNTKEKVSAKQLVDLFVPSVTCGVILSTTLFLVMPEAIVFIQRGTSSEVGEIEISPETIAGFGVAVMAGFMLPLIIAALFPRSSEYIHEHRLLAPGSLSNTTRRKSHTKKLLTGSIDEIDEGDEEKTAEDAEESLPSNTFDSESYTNGGESTDKADNDTNYIDNPKTIMTQKEINFRMATTICIGNSMQNLIDGFFVGIAFMTCSHATAICVTIVTAYIKITQEVADYFLLTQSVGVSIPRALLLIFAAGIALVVGSLSIISFNLDELTIGVFLSITAGVYLQKSASECLPRVYSVVRDSRDRYFSLLFFILGAIPIGISLIENRHCDA